MEIREKVAEYVQRRVEALRKEHSENGGESSFQNVSVVRANTMKYLCNFFKKGQLEKLLFLFPDPHFKASNHRCAQIRSSATCYISTSHAPALTPSIAPLLGAAAPMCVLHDRQSALLHAVRLFGGRRSLVNVAVFDGNGACT